MTTLMSHPEHAALGYAERGNTSLLGDAGHWHRTTQPSRGETRAWVRGTVEDCDRAYSAEAADEVLLEAVRDATEAGDPMPAKLAHFPRVEEGRIHFLSGEAPPTDFQEHVAPNEPQVISEEQAQAFIPHTHDDEVLGHTGDSEPHLHGPSTMLSVTDEAAEFNLGHHVHMGEVRDLPPLAIVKPERGGKRTCDCSHSESRHNASGACRTCGCLDFRVEV